MEDQKRSLRTANERFFEHLAPGNTNFIGSSKGLAGPGIFFLNHFKSVDKESLGQSFLHSQCKDLGLMGLHVANERNGSDAERMILNGQGLRGGYPDYTLIEPEQNTKAGDAYVPGLAIELKVGANNPSESQLRELVLLSIRGYVSIVAYSRFDALMAVDSYLTMTSHPATMSVKYPLLVAYYDNAKTNSERVRKKGDNFKIIVNDFIESNSFSRPRRNIKMPRGIKRV